MTETAFIVGLLHGISIASALGAIGVALVDDFDVNGAVVWAVFMLLWFITLILGITVAVIT